MLGLMQGYFCCKVIFMPLRAHPILQFSDYPQLTCGQPFGALEDHETDHMTFLVALIAHLHGVIHQLMQSMFLHRGPRTKPLGTLIPIPIPSQPCDSIYQWILLQLFLLLDIDRCLSSPSRQMVRIGKRSFRTVPVVFYQLPPERLGLNSTIHQVHLQL